MQHAAGYRRDGGCFLRTEPADLCSEYAARLRAEVNELNRELRDAGI